MSEENVVDEVLASSDKAAVYAMKNTTSSSGALAAAKSRFAEVNGLDYAEVDGTLFTKGFGPAEKIAAVKHG